MTRRDDLRQSHTHPILLHRATTIEDFDSLVICFIKEYIKYK